MKVWDLDEEFNIVQAELNTTKEVHKQMENTTEQTSLETGIGTKEPVSLQPAKVKIENVNIEVVGDKKNEILKCAVKHPDKDELIKISEVKYEKNSELRTSALWVNKDDDGLIYKGSALATLLEFTGAKTPKDLEGKELDTVLDDRSFLAFKAY